MIRISRKRNPVIIIKTSPGLVCPIFTSIEDKNDYYGEAFDKLDIGGRCQLCSALGLSSQRQVRALGTISRIRPPLDVLREFIAEPAAGDPRPPAAPPLIGRSLPDKDFREASDVHLNKCDWFAGELAQYLERCMQWHEFQHLVLVAPSNMLLALRGNLTGAMRSMVGVEVDQDLIKSSKTQIQARLRSLAIN